MRATHIDIEGKRFERTREREKDESRERAEKETGGEREMGRERERNGVSQWKTYTNVQTVHTARRYTEGERGGSLVCYTGVSTGMLHSTQVSSLHVRAPCCRYYISKRFPPRIQCQLLRDVERALRSHEWKVSQGHATPRAIHAIPFLWRESFVAA